MGLSIYLGDPGAEAGTYPCNVRLLEQSRPWRIGGTSGSHFEWTTFGLNSFCSRRGSETLESLEVGYDSRVCIGILSLQLSGDHTLVTPRRIWPGVWLVCTCTCACINVSLLQPMDSGIPPLLPFHLPAWSLKAHVFPLLGCCNHVTALPVKMWWLDSPMNISAPRRTVTWK